MRLECYGPRTKSGRLAPCLISCAMQTIVLMRVSVGKFLRSVRSGAEMPHMPDNWESFILSLMFLLIFPLSPLGFELLFTGTVAAPTTQIAAAAFGLGIAASSRDKLIFGLGVSVGVVFAASYGNTVESGVISVTWLVVTVVSLLAVGVPHVFERYNRHVVDKQPFPEFMR